MRVGPTAGEPWSPTFADALLAPRRYVGSEGDERPQDLDGQSVADIAVNARHQRSVMDDPNLAGVGPSAEFRVEAAGQCVSVPLIATLRLLNCWSHLLPADRITEYEPPPNVATFFVRLLIKREPAAGL